MKNTIFTVLLDIMANMGFAENYFPNGMIWTSEKEDMCDGTKREIAISVLGDTIINGAVYQIIGDRYVREQDKRIYVVDETGDSLTEILLYDFNVEEGDEFNGNGEYMLGTVVKVDTIQLLDGRKAKRIRYECGMEDVEFIGNLDFFYKVEIPLPCVHKEHLCCSINNLPLYEAYAGACNRSTDTETINTIKSTNHQKYNILGQPIVDDEYCGIIIQNGRIFLNIK